MFGPRRDLKALWVACDSPFEIVTKVRLKNSPMGLLCFTEVACPIFSSLRVTFLSFFWDAYCLLLE